MKKYIFICLFIILLSGCSNDKLICSVPNCSELCEYSYNMYCPQHTCQQDGCFEKKWSEDKFCVTHKYNNNISIEEERVMPEKSISEAKKVDNEYCNL